MIPFAIRGVLWDQGEGGTNIADVDQDIVMAALIGQWRCDWGQGDFPWLYVQKPSGGACALDPQNRSTKAPIPSHLFQGTFATCLGRRCAPRLSAYDEEHQHLSGDGTGSGGRRPPAE